MRLFGEGKGKYWWFEFNTEQEAGECANRWCDCLGEGGEMFIIHGHAKI